MSLSPTRQRQAPCPCGSRRPLAACCLPWEEALQRFFSRLIVFASAPRILRIEASAAAIFWDTQRPLQPGKGQAAVESLRFLEWFLHDHAPRRGSGPLLAEFADSAVDLSPQEEALLLASLLAPVRAYEVTETLGPRAILVKDLLTGAERRVGPLGFFDPPIRSDVLICRLLPLGHLTRPGGSYLMLPAAGREEMLAYLRTAYRLARPARHVSLEDFLDGSPHLYHHFFLHRGRDLGGRARETLRRIAFAPGRAIYRGADVSRIRASLDRQPELEREAGTAEEVRYVWVDLEHATTRATVFLSSGAVEVRADTPEDLAEAMTFLETCLRGLTQAVEQMRGVPETFPGEVPLERRTGPPGAAFVPRFFDRWPETPSPLLDDRTPQEVCRSRGGRQRVMAILLDLERDLNRLKRLGRPSIDLTFLWEQLDLTPTQPEPARQPRR
jgi:hypothetical protein